MDYRPQYPPRLAVWLFEKLLPFDHQKTSLGDIEEVYSATAEEYGRRRAIQWYLGQLILALPHSLSNFLEWGFYMIKHYAISATRNFKRNFATSFVNVAGLTVAVGATIVMFLFIDMQLNMDRFHENLDNIYMVEYSVSDGDDEQEWANSPRPLGPAIEASSPQVQHVVRLGFSSTVVRRGDLVFDETIRFADPAFFDVFTFPLAIGDIGDFKDESSVVLTPTIAEKYFGNENPIGQELELVHSNGLVEAVTVRGVTVKSPMAASFRFGILAPYSKLRSLDVDFEDWDSFTAATFVMLESSLDAPTVNEQLQQFVPVAQAANIDRDVTRFTLVPFHDVPTQGLNLRQSPLATINPYTALMCGIISLMVILVASFNYVTVAIATAVRRSKEIGIRKVVGSYRTQLIAQFMGENLILSVSALVLGVLLAETILIPWMNSLQAGDRPFELNYAKNMLLWGFLFLILIVTGLSAGVYPALFVSRFQPSSVLKGSIQLKGKRRLTRAMLTTQFLFSFLLLAFGFALYQNASYQKKIDWGYDPSQTVVIPFSTDAQLREFEHEIAQNPDIIRSAGTAQHVSRGGQTIAFSFNGQAYESRSVNVGSTYLETMKIRLLEGRFFHSKLGPEPTSSVMVNEQFLGHIGLEEGETALGQTIRIGEDVLEIVGVLEDFYYRPFIMGINPLIFRVVDEAQHRLLVVDFTAGSDTRVAEYLESTWTQLIPEAPYNGFFEDDIYDDYFVGMDSGAKIFGFISVVALVIAIVGLFGLVLISVTRRGREIGIRRMLGASVGNILGIMQREVVIIVLVALIIAVPLSYFGIIAMVEAMLPDAHGLTAWFVIIPTVIVVTATLTTSFAGVYRGAKMNPVDVLRENAA